MHLNYVKYTFRTIFFLLKQTVQYENCVESILKYCRISIYIFRCIYTCIDILHLLFSKIILFISTPHSPETLPMLYNVKLFS